jgi:hypothetical protein
MAKIKKMTSSTKYPIQRIINWYFGNFCTRKCLYDDKKLEDCHDKLQKFVFENKNLMMTHKEFKDLFDDGHIKICKLDKEFRKRTVRWNEFEKYLAEPASNSYTACINKSLN